VGVESPNDRLVHQLRRSGYSAPGFAARYDANRPRPPGILVELLPFLANVERPALVVDLGSGTGLSTRLWVECADAVVGVEPNPEMRAYAETTTKEVNVRYVAGSSVATGLPDECVDIVTSAQSLQWMEPVGTLREIGRILRPGGIFAAYNYRSLLTGSWDVDLTFRRVREAVRRRRVELGLDAGVQRWPPTLDRIEESKEFRFTSEASLHSVERGNADRLIGFLLSEGSVTTLLERVSEQAIGLDRLRAIATRSLGSELRPWYLGYVIWLAAK
jgi:SAM-dependent methyltransferase